MNKKMDQSVESCKTPCTDKFLHGLKQIGMICFSVFLSFPTLGNISAENDSPTCDESVLNADNGTANLEINWEPNVIPLKWYDGNTEITPTNPAATSCTYDDVLTIPDNPPEREGYVFDGWKVKEISGPNCPNISNSTTCNNTSGCVWTYGSCKYYVSDCSTITTQQTCESSGIGGALYELYCKWQNGACIRWSAANER